MRVALSLALMTVWISSAGAAVTATVYRADAKTPLAPKDPCTPDTYRAIMVGTHLTIFIESDSLDSASGDLLLSAGDMDRGLLAGRGEGLTWYQGSILEAAGEFADVSPGYWDGNMGFSFGTFYPFEVGRWFVFDYYATAPGDCSVYRYDEPGGIVAGGGFQYLEPEEPMLVQALSFHHVSSSDFDEDALVDFRDFAVLASMWNPPVPVDANEVASTDPGEVVPPDPNATSPLDLTDDGFVDMLDMLIFADFWLERTDISEPNDPNAPAVTDPNQLPAAP